MRLKKEKICPAVGFSTDWVRVQTRLEQVKVVESDSSDLKLTHL